MVVPDTEGELLSGRYQFQELVNKGSAKQAFPYFPHRRYAHLGRGGGAAQWNRNVVQKATNADNRKCLSLPAVVLFILIVEIRRKQQKQT